MTDHSTTTERTSLAALVAHEDLKAGDFVTVLNDVVELPSFLWCDASPKAGDAVVRVRLCADGGGMPLKVKAVCLPFVYVRSPEGFALTLDVRQVELVRLKKQYAKTIWKDFRKQRSKQKKRN